MLPLKIAILWHFHQPYYKKDDEFILPWVRLHGVKDYRDLPELALMYPRMKQTINIVPSLMMQLEEYLTKDTIDKVQRLSLLKHNDLTEENKREILRYFFLCNLDNMVLPYARYRELWEKFDNNYDNLKKYDDQYWLDLQVWYNLTWVGYSSRDKAIIKRMFSKERNFTENEKIILLDMHLQILSEIKPQIKVLKSLEQVEFSCSPMYHPILPLLCDTNSTLESRPNSKLPNSRFIYPQDALAQVRKAINYLTENLDFNFNGMWPSEGSISNEVLDIIASCGIKWIASDEQVLAETLKEKFKETDKYFPHKFKTKHGDLAVLFRDHILSDTIGFIYSKWNPFDAVNDFMHRLRHIKSVIVNSCGEDALNYAVVPIILDGENCWEYYPENGIPFRKELFHQLSDSGDFKTVTFSEAVSEESVSYLPKKEKIRAGSWINANFDIWIGHQEHLIAWDMLAKARADLEEAKSSINEEDYKKALEEIYIAEGSDWFWWYGDTHNAENKRDFDVLFRWHLSQCYKIVGIEIPNEINQPIGANIKFKMHQNQTGKVNLIIDGKISSESDWGNAGFYDAVASTGAMHQVGEILKRFWFANYENNVFIRIETLTQLKDTESIEIKILHPKPFSIHISTKKIEVISQNFNIDCFNYISNEVIELSFPKKWIFDKDLSNYVEIQIMTRNENGFIEYPQHGAIKFEEYIEY